MEKMLDLKEVAALIDLKPRTLRRWIKRGEFPGPLIRKPRVHRWSQGQLDRWLETSGRKTRLSTR